MRSSLKKDFIRDELTSGEMLSMMGIQESHYSRYKMVGRNPATMFSLALTKMAVVVMA